MPIGCLNPHVVRFQPLLLIPHIAYCPLTFGKKTLSEPLGLKDTFQDLFAAAAAVGTTQPSELRSALYERPPFPEILSHIDCTLPGDPVKSAVVLNFDHRKSTFVKRFQD